MKAQDVRTLEDDFQPNLTSKGLLAIIKRADEITTSAESDTMIQQMLDLTIEVTRADSAIFFQLTDLGDELIISHIRGDAENQNLVGFRLNCQQNLPGISLGDMKVMMIGDLPSDVNWLGMIDPITASRKKNVVNLPVINRNHKIGVIQVFNYKQVDLDLLLVLCTSLAVELDRNKEMDSIQRSNGRLLTLVEMLGDVAGILDRNQLLHMVAENAAHLVNAERSSLFLVNPATNEKIFQVAYQPQDQEQTHPLQTESYKRTRYSERTQHGENNANRPNHYSDLQSGEYSFFNRSAITAPIRSDLHSSENEGDLKHILGGLMVLNKRSESFQEEDAKLIRILANHASTYLQVAAIYESTGELFMGVIKSLVTAIDAKDPYTQGHSQRVSDYSVLIARQLGLDETLVSDIRIGSLLHDIGKIGISDAILLKPSQLNNEEFTLIREHPRTGINILSQVKALDSVQPAIVEHHERLDGSGYPNKLAGKQISLMGRIVAVADVFDAMTSDRPYRKALSFQEVLSYLYGKVGILFDAVCVEALDHVLDNLNPE